MKKDEEVNSYRLTTVSGSHHGQTVVLAGTKIFCSSFFPQAWELRCLHGGLTCTQMRFNCSDKLSKILRQSSKSDTEA